MQWSVASDPVAGGLDARYRTVGAPVQGSDGRVLYLCVALSDSPQEHERAVTGLCFVLSERPPDLPYGSLPPS